MTFDEKIQWFAHNDDDTEDFGDPADTTNPSITNTRKRKKKRALAERKNVLR